MAVPMPRWRFSIADLERMIEVGTLDEDDRVELIQGEIVQRLSLNRPCRPTPAPVRSAGRGRATWRDCPG
jgi:hypothetical protein